jgi:hypothetical protein
MTVYEVPPDSPYQRQFRFLGWGAIIVLLGILFFSIYEPAGLRDSIGQGIGWLAGAIALAAIVGATVLAVKEGNWKLMRRLRFEIYDGKIIKARAESSSIEIPLDQIESLYEYRGWLFIRGGIPSRQIGIPKEVNGFDILKHELVAHCPLTPLKVSPLSFLPLVLMILPYIFLFASHARAVVIAAGVAALALQGVGMYSLRRVWREKPMPKLVMPTFVLVWLLLAWLVYQRVSTTL